jgi:uncharacterized protein YjaG (DUF416 family)
MAKLAHGKSLKDAEKALKEYWRERIAISWCIEDVLGRAEDRDIELTEDQALDVLSAMESGHDCEIGINWNVIDFHIDEVIEDA